MKFRVGRKKGDTLVEVMFAIGIFSLVAITITSVLMSGSSNMQTSLETTMARNEIDAQAEALRFIHQGYISEKSDEVSGPYTSLWNQIVDLAKNNDTALARNSANVVEFRPSTCSALYDENAENGLKKLNAFAIDTQNIGSENAVKKYGLSNEGNFIESSLYPRLFYSNTDYDGALLARSTILRGIEGLFIVGVRDQDTTSVVKDDEQVNGSTAFYDFYIRSCWYGYGKKTPTTISTLIRLYDPDVEIENHNTMDFVLSFDWSGHDCGKVNSSSMEPCPVKKIRKAVSYNETFPATTIDNVPAEGYFSYEEPLGWSRRSDAKCGESDVLKKGDIISDFRNTAGAHPFRTYYAVWECKYSISYDKSQKTSDTGTVSFNPTSEPGYSSVTSGSTYKFIYSRTPDANGDVTISLINTLPSAASATFAGWKCKTNCTGEDTGSPLRQPGSSVIFHRNEQTRVYKADWNTIPKYTYSLSFNLNGGSGSGFNAQSFGPSTDTSHQFTIPSDSPTKSSNNFKGWSTTNGGAVVYSAGGTVALSSSSTSLTLYAVWEEVPQISYHCPNGGTLVEDSPKGAICVTSGSYYAGSEECISETTEEYDDAYRFCSTIDYSGGSGSTSTWGNPSFSDWYVDSYVYVSGESCSGTWNGKPLVYWYKHHTVRRCLQKSHTFGGYYCPYQWKEYRGSGVTLMCYRAATPQ